MQEKEQAYSVFLRTECDGETDRIFARAEKKEKGSRIVAMSFCEPRS